MTDAGSLEQARALAMRVREMSERVSALTARLGALQGKGSAPVDSNPALRQAPAASVDAGPRQSPYFRLTDACTGCLACEQNCPALAIAHEDFGDSRRLSHNMARCARCCTCWRVCPEDAVAFRYLIENEWESVLSVDLVRCRVCGEPVHGAALPARVGQRQEGDGGARLTDLTEALCDQHRAVNSAADQVAARLGRRPGEGSAS